MQVGEELTPFVLVPFAEDEILRSISCGGSAAGLVRSFFSVPVIAISVTVIATSLVEWAVASASASRIS